jgi:hypothetical protein
MTFDRSTFPLGRGAGGSQLRSSLSSSSEFDGRLNQIPSRDSSTRREGPTPGEGEKGAASGLSCHRRSSVDLAPEQPASGGGGEGGHPSWGQFFRGLRGVGGSRSESQDLSCQCRGDGRPPEPGWPTAVGLVAAGTGVFTGGGRVALA